MKESSNRIRMLLFVCVFLLAGAAAMAQNRTVKGKVTSSDDSGGLPGVNVVQKNTSRGVTTDQNGDFSIEITGNDAVLVFSFVGYERREVAVGNRSVVDVMLLPDENSLNEVVVTALGIKREEKSLGYSVGKVDGKELNQVVQENVLNGLAGRVSGVTINSTGGTGSSVSMVIRGANSLNSDNQPLFVIDGVPISNTLNNISEGGRDNRVDFGNAISNLNPDDIENISILKGPSAAALYGSRAGNGVVLITTKSGASVNKMTVTVNSSTVFDKPYKFLNWQNYLGPGLFSSIPPELTGNPGSNFYGFLGGLIDESAGALFGAQLDKGYEEVQWNSPVGADGKRVKTPLVSHPDNVKNFVQTGITTTNGISVANNTATYNYRLSYSNMTNKGIIPNTDLFRNTVNLNTALKLTSKLTLSSVIDFSRNNSNNRPAGNRGSNPLQWAYNTSPHVDIRDMRDYWVPGQEGLQQRSWSRAMNNPYFLAYEVNNSFERDRIYGNIKADYQLTSEFSLMARYSLDKLNEVRDMRVPYSYTEAARGAYGLYNINNFEHNMDFLATYRKDFGGLNMSVSAGGNNRYNTGYNHSNSSKEGGLIVPNLYTVQNIAPEQLNFNSYTFKRAIYSVYGLATLGYKDMIYLDVTARNDWSSTLPAENRSYFYPSASLSVLANEFIPLSSKVNMLKLRAGVAQVGNDASPYSLLGVLGNAGAWAGVPRLTTPGTLLTPDLKPEIVTSYEGGIDLTMYNNRLRFSGTWYLVESRNQILNAKLPPSSGYISKNINAGLVASRGWEFTLGGTPVAGRDFRWDVNFNWTRNRTKIVELADDIPYFTLWEDAKGAARTYVGEEIGDIYDAEVVTVKDPDSPYYGYPIINPNDGLWQHITHVNAKNKVGNFNPKFIMGMQSSLSYKGFNLNFSLDWRNGGNFLSQTYRYGDSNGQSGLAYDNLINPGSMTGKELSDYLKANPEQLIYVQNGNFPKVGGPTPDWNSFPFMYDPGIGQEVPLPHGGVFIPGVIDTKQVDENGKPVYRENLGEAGTKFIPFGGSNPWEFASPYIFDASFVKLREISLGYNLPQSLVSRWKIQNVNFSVYSRNILLWTAAKINIDPETAFQLESGIQGGQSQFKQGIERYNVNPLVIPVGFKLGITF